MKKLLTIFLLSWITCNALAQDDEVIKDPTAREKIIAARAAYITQRLAFTPDQAEKFWPVYNEYAQKRKDLHLQYRRAKKSGEDETALVELGLTIKQQELDLEKEYSERLLKIISAQQLLSLRQAEQDFRKLLLRQLAQRQNPKRQRLKDR
jgi:hypothetical protein